MTVRNDIVPHDAVAVTPSDTAFVDFVQLYIGVSGDVAVECEGGVSVTLKAHPVGYTARMHIIRVMATGTAATNIVGLKA
jgi:hypothetical protein